MKRIAGIRSEWVREAQSRGFIGQGLILHDGRHGVGVRSLIILAAFNRERGLDLMNETEFCLPGDVGKARRKDRLAARCAQPFVSMDCRA
jgi:hypothetical protein